MDFTNFWFPKKKGPSGDPGDPIGQSLRFDGSCQMYRNSFPITPQWTASFWIKHGFGSPDKGGYAFSWHFGSSSYVVCAVGVGNSGIYTGSSSSGNCLLVCRDGLNTWADVNTSLQLRDDSAWYHHTIHCDNGTLDWYINGNAVGTVTGVRTSGTSSNFTIGGQNQGSGINAYFSDFYFIDSQVLEPTAFGRFNKDGVWVPREVDFTPATMRYSDYLTANSGGDTYEPVGSRTGTVNNPQNGFDGRVDTQATTANNNAIIFFNSEFESVTSLKVNSGRNIVGLWINGTKVSYTDPDGPDWWRDISAHIPADGKITEIAIQNGAGNTTWLGAIEITDANGTRILTNPFLYSADLTTNSSDWETSRPPTAAFDGSTSTYARSQLVGETITFEPSSSISFTNTLRVWGGPFAGQLLQYNDGADIALNAAGWTDIVTSGGGTLNKLFIDGNTTDAALSAVEVDGQILVDGVNNSYGVNGFHLTFADPNNVGKDYSGNGNDFTASGFELTNESILYDWFLDSPTNNTGTLNPISRTDAGYDGPYNANCSYDMTATVVGNMCNTNVLDFDIGTGKYQIEIQGNGQFYPPYGTMGAIPMDDYVRYFSTASIIGTSDSPLSFYYGSNGSKYQNGTSTAFGGGFSNAQGASGTSLGFVFDLDAKTCEAYLDGASQGIIQDNMSGLWTVGIVTYGNQHASYIPTAFKYPVDGAVPISNLAAGTPPITNGRDHFQALTTGPGTGQSYAQGQIDITSPFVPDPAEEVAWRDSSLINYVGVVTLDAGKVYDDLTVWSAAGNTGLRIYISVDGTTWENTNATSQLSGYQIFSGPARYIRYDNGGSVWQADYFQGVGTRDILGLAQDTFPNGMWWIKDRVNSNHHQLVDSVRGGNLVLQPDSTGPETSYVAPAGDSVAWCWKAGDTVETDNTGTVESQVCVNHDAGFSIVQWVGTGGFDSIGHGLGKRPGMVITKTRQLDHWIVGVDGVTTLSGGGSPNQWINADSFVGTNWANGLILNSSNAATNYVASSGINLDGNNMMAYVWAPIKGFSAFGMYRGNQSTDGVFVYTGFAPQFLLLKGSNLGGDWIIQDSTRQVYNPRNSALYPNTTGGESTSAQFQIDFLSNGFKLRTDNATLNQAYDYVYACFAENPFQSPTTAR